MPSLSRITIFPIKSLDGVDVQEAKILASGSLEHDREYAIYDEQGRLVNGKRTARVHLLRTSFDLEAGTVTLRVQGEGREETFSLGDCGELEIWLSGHFGFRVKMRHFPSGLPDHGRTPGPTVISTASLEQVSAWFDSVSVAEVRKRFRANLEVSDTAPFWEDRLVDKPNTTVVFQVGRARIEGVYPCERCVVPSRDPLTGERYQRFERILAAKRKENMPAWAELSSFPHFYHFCVLTRVAGTEAGKVLRVGDEVGLLATRRLKGSRVFEALRLLKGHLYKLKYHGQDGS